MLQVVQNYRTGVLSVETVPEPACRSGTVQVRTAFSVVSSGTEVNAVREASMSLMEKARARPDQVRMVANVVRSQGLLAAYRSVMNRLDSLTPLGYSCSGTVAAVSSGVQKLRMGQRVACGGVGLACHAEVNCVPVNLVVPLPENVSLAEGACTTVGAVALQGFRQTGLSVGDTIVIIGQGLVGFLCLQIARAAGCRTVAIDLNPDRLVGARAVGADAACTPELAPAAAAVDELTEGLGADAVVLAVGTDSNEPLELAAVLARDRGRIVCLGKARMDLPYAPFFKKDLNVVFSRSYGPGRYDPIYEEKGIDYPPGYVKWTERRNMAGFLELVAQKKVDLQPLIRNPVPFAQAPEAYELLRKGKAELAILFEYESSSKAAKPKAVEIRAKVSRPSKSIVLGCIGAGNYASTKLLPVLQRHVEVRFRTVVTSGGLSAVSAARKFPFERASIDASDVFSDNEINAVLIATPHASHARLIADALRSGKAVFAEKPMAITAEQLCEVAAAVQESGNDRLQIGFNRRFAPLSLKVKDALDAFIGPRTVLIRINAGKLPPGKWVSDVSESGGRIVGEACHFVDLAGYFIGEDPVKVSGIQSGRDPDDLTITLSYPGGSAATIMYSTVGGPRLPKEYIEIHTGGVTAIIDDFRRADLFGDKRKRLGSGIQDKGQAAELDRFCGAVVNGSPMPISLRSLFATTEAAMKALRSVQTGDAEYLESKMFAVASEAATPKLQ